MNSPERKKCFPPTGPALFDFYSYQATKLPYNETSAKELSSPVFYTGVCNPPVKLCNNRIKNNFCKPVIEKLANPQNNVNSKMCRNECSEGQSCSAGLLHPTDSNDKRTKLPHDQLNSSSDLLNNSGVNSFTLDSTTNDTNNFLSADSNFRKYPFENLCTAQSNNSTSTNCNTIDCNRISNLALTRKSVENESQQSKGFQAGVSRPEIIIVSLSDDEENKTNTQLEHEANTSQSSSGDIEVISYETAAPEPVMPQLSPLGSDIYTDESNEQKSEKEIEVIDLPDSPEMPTLVPFIMESPPPPNIATRTCTPPLSKSNSNFNCCDSSSSRDIDECNKHCNPVHSNPPSTMDIRQPKVVLTRIPVGNCSTVQLSGAKFICSEEPSLPKDVAVAKKGPEVDTIDGLNFFSFASKPEMEKYCEEHSSNLLFNIKKENFIMGEPFFTDTSGMNSSQVSEITHAKSWESKYVSPVFDNDDDDELYKEISIQNKNNSIPYESRTSDLVDHLPKEEEMKKIEFSKNEPISLLSNPSNNVNLASNDEHLEKSPESTDGVFRSGKLDEFLKNNSKLQVTWLQKTNPNITPIPPDAPILSIGKLRKDDEDNVTKPLETSSSSISVRHQTLVKAGFDEEKGKTSDFLKTKFNNSLSSLTEDKESPRCSASSVKRKAVSLGPTKKPKLMKNYKSELGTKRLVLTLKKESTGFCEGYKVASVSSACIEKESSTLSPPKTSPKSVSSNHKNPPDYYKEILFSPPNKKKESNLVEQFITNFNSLGTRKGVTMLVNSNRSPFVNCEALPSKCATVVEFLDSFIQKQGREKSRGRPKRKRSFTNLVVSPKQDKIVKSKASHGMESTNIITPNQSAELCSSESEYLPPRSLTEEGNVSLRNKRSTRLPQRLLDSAILSPGREWVSPTITEDSEITPKRSKKLEPKKADIILDTPNNSNLKEKKSPDNADKGNVTVENDFGVINIGSHMTVASDEPNSSINIPLPSSENKRIRNDPLCFCNNTSRAMTYNSDMKQLVCSCALSMLTGYASCLSKDSVTNSCEKTLNNTPLLENLVILQQFEKRKQEIQSSGKSECCKELGLHNYAINPNLESKEMAIQVKSKSAVHLPKLSFQEKLKDLDTSTNSQLSKPQAVENTTISTIENVIKVPDVSENDERKITYPVTLASPHKNCDDVFIDVEEEESICTQEKNHSIEQHNNEGLIPMKVISTSGTGHPIEFLSDKKNISNREDAVLGGVLNQTVRNCEQVIAKPLNFGEKSCSNTVSKASPTVVHTNKKISYVNLLPVNFNKSVLGVTREGVLTSQKSMQVCGSNSSSSTAITAVTAISPKLLYVAKNSVTKQIFNSQSPSRLFYISPKNSSAISASSSKINPVKSSPETPVVLAPSIYQRSPMTLKNFVQQSSRNHTFQGVKSRQDLTVLNQQNRTSKQSVMNALSSELEEKSSVVNNADVTNCTDGTNKLTEPFASTSDLLPDAESNPAFEQQCVNDSMEQSDDLSDSDLVVDIETVDDNFFTKSQQKDCSSRCLPNNNNRGSKESDTVDETSSSTDSDESIAVDQNARPVTEVHEVGHSLKKTREKIRRLKIRKNTTYLQKTLGRRAANFRNLLEMAEKEIKTLLERNKGLNVTIFNLLSHRQNLQKIYRRHAMRLPPVERKAEASSLLLKLRSAVCPDGSREFPAPPSLLEMNPYLRAKTNSFAGAAQESQNSTEPRENSPEIEVLPVPKKEAECIDLVESDEELDLKASANEKLSDDEEPAAEVNQTAEQSKDSLVVQKIPETRQAQATYDTLFTRWTTAFQMAQPSSSRHSAGLNVNALSSQPSTNISAIGVQNQKSSALPAGVRLVSFKPFGNLTSPLDRTKFKEAQQILNNRIAPKISSCLRTVDSTSSTPGTGQQQQSPCQIPVIRVPETAFTSPIRNASKTGHERIQNMHNAMQQLTRPSSSASSSPLSLSGSIVVRPPIPVRNEPEMLLNVGGSNVYQWTTPRNPGSDSVGNVLPSNSSAFTFEECSPVKVADVVSLSCSKNNDSVS